MSSLAELVKKVSKQEHGFKLIEKEAENLAGERAPTESYAVAMELFQSDQYQARVLSVFVLGSLAANSAAALQFLREEVSRDKSWQVQEILAKAFDQYSKDVGYEKALPVIEDWLADKNPNVRRAVTEGLRIWTTRPYFKEHPEIAVKFLSQLRADDSQYVRKSVGNALRDISKKHPDLIKAELENWDLSDKKAQFTHKLASKFLGKNH